MSSTVVAELRTEVTTRFDRLKGMLEQAGPERDFGKVTDLSGNDGTEKLHEWQRLYKEYEAKSGELQRLQEVERQAGDLAKSGEWLKEPGAQVRHANASQTQPASASGLAEMLANSEGLKAFKQRGYAGHAVIGELELPQAKALRDEARTKTLFTLTTLSPVTQRQPGIQPSAIEMRTVRDLMPNITVSGPISYLVETTFTNSAVEVTEGSTKPESALATTETTERPAVIATFLPATRQVLDDLPYLQEYIQNRLGVMVERRAEAEILSGDGIAPDLTGFLNRSGIQTQALVGGENNADTVLRGMTKVRNVAFAEPSAVVMHPTNMLAIMLLKDANGNYIYGGPANANSGKTLWGLEVRQTTGITLNTALVGDFRTHAAVLERDPLRFMVSTEHSDFFIRNQIAILAEERLGLAVYRPAAFCTCTSLS